MGQRNEISILCCCNRPQEYVYQGSPPIIPIKTQKTLITSSVFPPFYLQKLSKHRTNGESHALPKHFKNIKKNLVENRQNRPYYLQKLKKHRTNSFLMGKNQNTIFVEKRQNRPSEIRFTGVLPPLYYLQKLKKHRTNSVLMGEN